MYLTQQQKKEIESKILDLKKEIDIAFDKKHDNLAWVYSGQCSVLEDIVSKAIVLPVEESWSDTSIWQHDGIREHFEAEYPIGVIIKPKES
jgi:hypothetical protein